MLSAPAWARRCAARPGTGTPAACSSEHMHADTTGMFQASVFCPGHAPPGFGPCLCHCCPFFVRPLCAASTLLCTCHQPQWFLGTSSLSYGCHSALDLPASSAETLIVRSHSVAVGNRFNTVVVPLCKVLVAKVTPTEPADADSKTWDIQRPLVEDCCLRLCTFEDVEGKDVSPCESLGQHCSCPALSGSNIAAAQGLCQEQASIILLHDAPSLSLSS